jgi:hypothetical protein
MKRTARRVKATLSAEKLDELRQAREKIDREEKHEILARANEIRRELK